MPDIELSLINSKIEKNPLEFVRESENNYRGFVCDVAHRVAKEDRVRVILLAGPSGSGKTTTANILSDEIKAAGLHSFVVSLDDFYRDADDVSYPRLPSGERDYEAAEALNLPEIESCISDIIEGREFSVPKYDFKLGRRTVVTKYDKISHGCVIIEGLHALNPKISCNLQADKVLKIFISVSTNVTSVGERILSGRKIRFVRRMVRDSIYRAASAERTLEMWENVLSGEDKYLYPFRSLADIEFNTFHPFELSVTRGYAEKLISRELAEKNEYAGVVLSAITRVLPLDESLVPDESLIREFITGGKYEEFY